MRLLLVLYFLLLIYGEQKSSIEFYGCQSQKSNLGSFFNYLVEKGINRVVFICSHLFDLKNDIDSISGYIQNLYEEIMVLKKENVSFEKKIIRLFFLIKKNIPEERHQKIIIKIYRDIMNIFL